MRSAKSPEPGTLSTIRSQDRSVRVQSKQSAEKRTVELDWHLVPSAGLRTSLA